MNDEIKWVDAGRDTKLIGLVELFQVDVLSYSCHVCPLLLMFVAGVFVNGSEALLVYLVGSKIAIESLR